MSLLLSMCGSTFLSVASEFMSSVNNSQDLLFSSLSVVPVDGIGIVARINLSYFLGNTVVCLILSQNRHGLWPEQLLVEHTVKSLLLSSRG